MTSISETDIRKGQAVYTPLMLKIYDLWVLNISNSWIWRCSKRIQLEQFNRHATANHLDIGVGTGYYLKNHPWPAHTKLSLMDLNPNCLEATKKLLHPITANAYLHDIFKPNTGLNNQFDSISMNYLLHCLPGSMQTKATALANAKEMLSPGGILFGATILADAQLHTKISQRLCAFYNSKAIFSNTKDTKDALQVAVTEHLVDVEIQIVGCVALFKGLRA
jgi:2-polyprenyl-3-methyl-5-hydroxy-6-metoxy-1,4-benzoquinol methylase